MPEITVVITTYNLEAYIGTCLEELFSGTYQDFDVVLVDDGSKDQTVDIVETSVSYTHLDVYKRQELRPFMGRFLEGAMLWSPFCWRLITAPHISPHRSILFCGRLFEISCCISATTVQTMELGKLCKPMLQKNRIES